jgi:hypothetical protein
MQFPNPVVSELIISYPTGSPAIQIGPGPEIIFYGQNGTTLTISANDPNNPGYPGLLFALSDGNTAYIDAYNSLSNPYFEIVGYEYTAADYGNLPASPYISLAGGEMFFGFATDNVADETFGAGFQLNDNSIYMWVGSPTVPNQGNSIHLDENNFYADIPFQVGSWQNVTLMNGWNNAGGDNANFQYRLCSDGFVHWRGVITPGTTTNGTVIATYASGSPYSPPESRYLYRSGADGTTPSNNPQVQFATNGNIMCFGMAGVTFLAFDGWLYESNEYMA